MLKKFRVVDDLNRCLQPVRNLGGFFEYPDSDQFEKLRVRSFGCLFDKYVVYGPVTLVNHQCDIMFKLKRERIKCSREYRLIIAPTVDRFKNPFEFGNEVLVHYSGLDDLSFQCHCVHCG